MQRLTFSKTDSGEKIAGVGASRRGVAQCPKREFVPLTQRQFRFQKSEQNLRTTPMFDFTRTREGVCGVSGFEDRAWRLRLAGQSQHGERGSGNRVRLGQSNLQSPPACQHSQASTTGSTMTTNISERD